MSTAEDRKSRLSETRKTMAQHAIPKLPPIPKLMTTKDRFDNSPLLKHRRSNEMQNLLATKVLAKATKAQQRTQDSLQDNPIKGKVHCHSVQAVPYPIYIIKLSPNFIGSDSI